MGSFNTTCAVSKTPIAEGQKARVFFLIMDNFSFNSKSKDDGLFHNIHQGLNCYPWDNFKIIGYPLLAEYQDYNHYHFEDSDMADLVLRIINKIYKPNLVQKGKSISDYNEYHDYMNIDTISDMKQLQDMEHSGALRVKSYFGDSLICKMAIHEDIYQKLILSGTVKRVKDFSDDTPYNFDQFVEYYISEIQKNNNEMKLSSVEKKIVERQTETFMALIGNKDKNGNIITEDSVKNSINDLKSGFLDSKKMKLFENEGERFQEQTHVYQDVKGHNFYPNIIEAWAGAVWTKNFFMNHNLEFAPVITSGQEVDFKSDAKYLLDLYSIINDLKTTWDDEDSLPIKRKTIVTEHLSLNDFKEKCEDWFAGDNKIIEQYKKVFEELNKEKPESFVVGDCSNFDKFCSEHYLIEQKDGSHIYFEYN